MLVHITLLGDLEQFQPSHRFDVSTLKEALRALETQIEGFRHYLINQALEGVCYKVIVAEKRELSEKQLNDPISKSVTIVPVISGSGNVGKIIGGLALVALGATGIGIGFLGISSTTLMLVGGTLALSGIVGLFNKPKTNEEDEKKQSFLFNGAVNNASGYGRVPIVLGAGARGTGIIVGSLVVSAGIRTFGVVV